MDERAFTALVEQHRRELRVHCYRMLGSLEDAEDLVQETFLRAWKRADTFEGRSTIRAWLYRIATNACLDALDGRARRRLPDQLTPPWHPGDGEPPRTDLPWLQPFPDAELPEQAAVARETVELAFLAAIQHLPPRQRAALILRDVLGWPAKDTAELLESSLASVNSALQRARDTLREHLPRRRLDWAAGEPTAEQLEVLRRYLDAMERTDLVAVAELLAEDVRAVMPPFPMWYRGRDAVMATLTISRDPRSPYYIGELRFLRTRANGRLAVAGYVKPPGGAEFGAFAISVLGFAGGLIADLAAFHEPALFPAFGLPMSFPAAGRLNEGR